MNREYRLFFIHGYVCLPLLQAMLAMTVEQYCCVVPCTLPSEAFSLTIIKYLIISALFYMKWTEQLLKQISSWKCCTIIIAVISHFILTRYFILEYTVSKSDRPVRNVCQQPALAEKLVAWSRFWITARRRDSLSLSWLLTTDCLNSMSPC